MRLDYHLGGLLLRAPADSVTYVLDLIRRRRSGPEGQSQRPSRRRSPTAGANVIRVNRRALSNYVPRPYPENVVMLLSSDEPDSAFFDPRLAWPI